MTSAALQRVKTPCHAEGGMLITLTVLSESDPTVLVAIPKTRRLVTSRSRHAAGPLTTSVSGTPLSSRGLCRLGSCGLRSRCSPLPS